MNPGIILYPNIITLGTLSFTSGMSEPLVPTPNLMLRLLSSHHLELFPIIFSVFSSRCMVFAKDRDVFCPIITCSWVSSLSSQDCSWVFPGSVERRIPEEPRWGCSLLSLPTCYSPNFEKLNSFKDDLRHLNSLSSGRSFRERSLSKEQSKANCDTSMWWEYGGNVLKVSSDNGELAYPNAGGSSHGSGSDWIANS